MIEKLYNLGFDFPFKIGSTRDEIIDKLGKPDKETFADPYLKHGLILSYNIYDELDEITATTMQNGSTYKGILFGVKIGDSVSKCSEIWGDSSYTEDKRYGYLTKVWNFGEINKTGILFVAVEYWNENGEEDGFGKYEIGQIKSIKIQIDDETPELI